jgi:HK97 gp10 family phage protein
LSRTIQRDALLAGGESIRASASAYAPHAPGAPDLRENIVMSNARPDDGSVGIAVGPAKDFFYGLFQEEGTVHHGAQPFMRPALDGEAQTTIGIIGEHLWDALASRGIGLGRTVDSSGPVIGGPGGGLL